jgi:hypothetical protein
MTPRSMGDAAQLSRLLVRVCRVENCGTRPSDGLAMVGHVNEPMTVVVSNRMKVTGAENWAGERLRADSPIAFNLSDLCGAASLLRAAAIEP